MSLRPLFLGIALAHALPLFVFAGPALQPDALLPRPENPLEALQRRREAAHDVTLPLFTASAARAETWFVWEGLPHPVGEKDLHASEKSRKPTAELHGDAFYSRAALIRSEDRSVFADLLSRAETYAVYGGSKLCGGFHADYALEWRANGRVYRALVCFGCHEIKLASDDVTLLCDLPGPAHEVLAAILKPYRRERPEQADPAR